MRENMPKIELNSIIYFQKKKKLPAFCIEGTYANSDLLIKDTLHPSSITSYQKLEKDKNF